MLTKTAWWWSRYSDQDGPWFVSVWAFLSGLYMFSPCLHGTLASSHKSKTLSLSLTGDSKLPLSMNLRVNSCPSLYVALRLAGDWCTLPLIKCQLGCTPAQRNPNRDEHYRWWIYGWMDITKPNHEESTDTSRNIICPKLSYFSTKSLKLYPISSKSVSFIKMSWWYQCSHLRSRTHCASCCKSNW